MHKIQVVLMGISLMALCCNSKKGESSLPGALAKQDDASIFTGNWISKNYLDSLQKYGMPSKVKGVLPQEIVFSFAADSLCVLNAGSGKSVFSISEKTGRSFRINKFNEDEFTDFYLSASEKEIFYENKTKNQKFSFLKIKPKYAVQMVEGWPSTFELYFNEWLIAANYFLLDAEKKPGAKVAFTSYGEIVGLPGYKKFKICYGENCRQSSDDDLIFLSDKEETENFIWEWEKDTLTFYSVTNISKPNEPPRYIKGMDIFKFKKNL